MTRRSTVSNPSTPQNLSAVEEGAAVDEVEVTEISDDPLEEIEAEDDVEESLDDDSLVEVLVVTELISLEIEVEIDEEALLALEL
jgi:hypothetical protein